ncbi:rRNA maturation RNase YbeY [Thiorhodospira sibirica]|uniref:rRNA maturation RNase YbeY n=1 Tax=Thiorhodospira sibirica TaxID=154347 RepID=UPI00022C1718|nr:rRNA maturation RNase YbeY [Thiorhodospira sibirica]
MARPELSPHHITIQYACARRGLPAAQTLRRIATAALEDMPPSALLIRLLDAPESALLNQQYRGKSGPTNVLSFVLHAPYDQHLTYLGDILICAPVVISEAQTQGKSVRAHCAHMVVHGVLHLRGHDHLTDHEATVMEALETRILNQLAYSNPYE